jgi:hypothetical protein
MTGPPDRPHLLSLAPPATPAELIATAFTRAMNADLPGMAEALTQLDPQMAGRVADAAACLSRAARHRAGTG